MIAFDDEIGFWLIHSVPDFPLPTKYHYPDSDFLLPTKYHYPDSGKENGQSFLCVTLTSNGENENKISSGINDIAGPLSQIKAFIYSQNVPSSYELKKYLPNVDNLLKKSMLHFFYFLAMDYSNTFLMT